MQRKGSAAPPLAAPPLATQSAGELITRAQPTGAGTGTVLQDFVPIAESIPWMRSQRFWSNAGLDVFLSGRVPYVATSNGSPSQRALEVFLANVRASSRNHQPRLYVLELGPGTGLFAKLFLDLLKGHCEREGSDEYQRITYILCDYSQSLLGDTVRSGVLGEHKDRVVRIHSSLQHLPEELRARLPQASGQLAAVHASYVLDSLPFCVLSRDARSWHEMRVRTRLCEPSGAPSPPPGLAAAELEQWLHTQLPAARQSHAGFRYDLEFFPVEASTLPLAEWLPGADAGPGQCLHSFGAMRCLSQLQPLLASDGYWLALDYSREGMQQAPLQFQMFDSSVAAGVHFAQLSAYVRTQLHGVVCAPEDEPADIQARLFGNAALSDEARTTFRQLFSQQAIDEQEQPLHLARACVSSKKYEDARAHFDRAHARQPHNWYVLEELAAFLAYTLSEHAAALEVARRALQLNHISPRLWNLVGDCYRRLGSLEQAEPAYEQALAIHAGDVRAHLNLASAALERARPQDALRLIGMGLSLDESGALREQLLAVQGEALREMTSSHTEQARESQLCLSGQRAPCAAR